MKTIMVFACVLAVAMAEESAAVPKEEVEGESSAEPKQQGKRGIFDLGYGGFDLGASSFGGNFGASSYGLGGKTVTITKEIPVAVPQPVAVPVVKHVGVPVPHAVPYPVYKPVPVAVEKPVAVPVEKPVPYPVVKKVPYPVHVAVKVPVPHPVPYPVEKRVPYPVHVPYKVPVPHPVPVYKHVPVIVKSTGHEGFGFGIDSYGFH